MLISNYVYCEFPGEEFFAMFYVYSIPVKSKEEARKSNHACGIWKANNFIKHWSVRSLEES